jgi:hypothetical protein
MITLDPKYAEAFESLFAANDFADTVGMLDYVEAYDELPVYTRYAQLEFLAGLGFAEANRQMIRAAVVLLERVVAGRDRSSGPKNLLLMVAVTGWDIVDSNDRSACNDGTMDFIKPYIWAGNLDNDRMAAFRATGDDLPVALR